MPLPWLGKVVTYISVSFSYWHCLTLHSLASWCNLPNTLKELNSSNNHWEIWEVASAIVETRDDLALFDILITAMWEALSQRMKLSHILILTSRQWECKCVILRCYVFGWFVTKQLVINISNYLKKTNTVVNLVRNRKILKNQRFITVDSGEKRENQINNISIREVYSVVRKIYSNDVPHTIWTDKEKIT